MPIRARRSRLVGSPSFTRQPQPRLPPKTYILTIKTHKLSVLVTVAQPDKTTIGELKNEVLSALTADVVVNPHIDDAMGLPEPDPSWESPFVDTVDDFELCRAVKEKGRPTGHYEPLANNETVKSSVANWESVFVQFKNEKGESVFYYASIASFHCVDAIPE